MGTLVMMSVQGDTRLMWDAGNEINEFDPDAQKIIMAPPMRGG